MANQQADGNIIIDTQIDSKGFEADSKEMRQAVKQLGSKMESLGPVFQKAVSGNASVLSTFKSKADTLRDTISSIEDKMAEIADKEYPLQEYTRATAEIEKTQQALEKLKAKEQELKASGKDIRFSDEYKAVSDAELKAIQQVEKLQEKLNNTSIRSPKHSALEGQIEQLKTEIAQYKQAKADMARDGSALQESQEWQQVRSQIEKTRNDLVQLQAQKQQLENSGQATVKGVDTQAYKEMNAQLQKSKSKLGEMNKEASKANGFASRLKGAFSKVAGVVGTGLKKGMTAFIGKIKSAHKASDGMHKKFLKMGLALVGMRGLMGGIKQLVSSAMSNNEQLQNQLNAVKGVLGQAIAPIINVLIKGLATLVTFADRLYSIFTGMSLISKYNAKQTAKASSNLGSAAQNAKKLTRQLAGFDELNVLSDNSSDSSGDGEDAATFDPVDLSTEMQDFINQFKKLWSEGDFEGIGALISSKIIGVLQDINWDNIKKKAFKGGKSFAELLNGLFEYSDADGNTLMSSIGKTIGEAFNTLLSVVDGFAANLHWANLGYELANGISTAITSIDWKLLFKTAIDLGEGFGDYINGIFEYKDKDGNSLTKNLGTGLSNAIHAAFLFVMGFVETINWQNIGKAIADFIEGIDWVQLTDDLITLLSDLCIALLDACIGLIEGIDWAKAVDDLFAMIGKLFTSVDWAGLASKLSQLLGDLVGAAFAILGQLTIDVAEFVQKIIDSIKDYFSQYFSWDDEPADVINGLLKGIGDAIKNVGTWIDEHIIQPFIDGVKKGFGIHSPSKVMAEIGGYIIEGFKNGITDVWDTVTDFFDTALSDVKESFSNAWSDLKTNATEKWENIKTTVTGKMSDIKKDLSDKSTSAKKTVTESFNTIKTNATNALSAARSNATSHFNTLKSNLSSAASTAKSNITNAFNSIKTNATNAISNLKTNASSNMNDIKSALTSKLNEAKTQMGTVSFVSIGRNICTGIYDGIKEKWDWLKNKVKDVADSLLTSAKNALDIHSPSRVFKKIIGLNIGAGIGNGIVESIPGLIKDVKTVASCISTEFDKGEYSISPVTIGSNSALIAGVEGFADTITDSFSDLISRLQSIADTVTFRAPNIAASGVIPYSVSASIAADNSNISDKIEASNDELASVFIQSITNQTAALVAALQSNKSQNAGTIDYSKLTSNVIDDINRRTRMLGASPLTI